MGTILTILLVVGFITNVVLAFVIIFLERDRRTASSTWAWLFVLFVLPVIGFILYLFFRTNGFQEKDGKNNGDELHAFEDLVQDQIDSFDKHNYGYINDQVIKHRDLIRMLLMKQDAF